MRPVYEIATAEGAELRRCGNTFRGLCLIHDRDGRNPSCVYGETRWHCFSCGEGGDGPALIMKTKGMSFPQALAYLGEDRPRPTRQEQVARTKERTERAAARWNESNLAWTIGKMIRLCHEALRDITPDTIDQFALILDQLPILQYHHQILIDGSPADKSAVMAEWQGVRLFKRTLLFKKNFDFLGWLRSVYKPQPPAEVTREPHGNDTRTHSIELLVG
jgi:hypothetical protein